MKTLLAVGVQKVEQAFGVQSRYPSFIQMAFSRAQPWFSSFPNSLLDTPTCVSCKHSNFKSQNCMFFLSPQNCSFGLNSYFYQGNHSYSGIQNSLSLIFPNVLTKITGLLHQLSRRFTAREAQELQKAGSPCRCPGKLRKGHSSLHGGPVTPAWPHHTLHVHCPAYTGINIWQFFICMIPVLISSSHCNKQEALAFNPQHHLGIDRTRLRFHP